MLAASTNGEDLHRKAAAAVAGVDIGAVSKEQRQMAKAVNFGLLLYSQGPAGLARVARSRCGTRSCRSARARSAAKSCGLPPRGRPFGGGAGSARTE